MSTRFHKTIMADEVIKALPPVAHNILDGTVGHAGHTIALYDHLCQQDVNNVYILGIDKDVDMLQTAQTRIPSTHNIQLHHAAYDDRSTIGSVSNNMLFDFMLLDIGINRGHIRDASRGFSIKSDGPLDMRFDPTTGQPVSQYLHQVHVQDLSTKLQNYGDFSDARAAHIARHITRSQQSAHIKTTQQLVQVLYDIGLGGRQQAVVFQVLRIIVNDELGHLKRFLETFQDHLTIGGRCAIMTFHSIEDRMVKRAFKKLAQTDSMSLINKKVIKPHRQEQERNKACKSAKLRIIEKIA